MVNLVKKKVS